MIDGRLDSNLERLEFLLVHAAHNMQHFDWSELSTLFSPSGQSSTKNTLPNLECHAASYQCEAKPSV